MSKEGIKIVARNRKASHEYHLMDTYEAGLVLLGSEIKSIRAGHVQLQEAFVNESDGELWVLNMHISEYQQAHKRGHEPLRPRKLLLHRKEINKIRSEMAQKGFTVIATALYLKNGRAKLEIALAKGKKLYDKRQDMRKKDDQRQMERALRDYR